MAKAQRNEAKLPQWAQRQLAELRYQLAHEQESHARTRKAHALLLNHEWFTLLGERAAHSLHSDGPDRRMLYWGIMHPACDLGPDDVLLIGRARR